MADAFELFFPVLNEVFGIVILFAPFICLLGVGLICFIIYHVINLFRR